MSSSSHPSSSPPERIRIRVRSGQSEAEIEADAAKIREAIELIPEVVSRLPLPTPDRARPASALMEPAQEPSPGTSSGADVQPTGQPGITVEKGDSLSDIISKFFTDPWGKSPRKLSDVRETLQAYGLNYPKQSVAVALLRLAKSSKIRRFKSAGGEYVYTASTSMMTTPSQVLILPDDNGGGDEPALESAANV